MYQYIFRICNIKLYFTNYLKSDKVLKHKTVQFNRKHRYIGKKPKLCAVCTSNRLSNKSTDSAWLVSS